MIISFFPKWSNTGIALFIAIASLFISVTEAAVLQPRAPVIEDTPLAANATPAADTLRSFNALLNLTSVTRSNLTWLTNQNLTGSTQLKRRQSAVKIMIVGDSISQGQQGDWTWRYRLWQWTKSQGLAVSFVGPYSGTIQPSTPGPPPPPLLQGQKEPDSPLRTSGGYAVGVDGGFDSHHFAIWGRQVAQDKGLIKNMVAQYSPDILLVELGFNDVGWFVSDAQGTMNSMRDFIEAARAAKPNIKLAVANIPHRTSLGEWRADLEVKTNGYNKVLPQALRQWSNSNSPLVHVDFAGTYQCGVNGCPDGYDGLHPNARGEYRIARAFSLALVNDFKIGKSALEVPADVPQRPTPVPSNFKAFSSPTGVTVTWDAVYGAISYELSERMVGAADWGVFNLGTNRWDTTWCVSGLKFEYRLRTRNLDVNSDYTATVSASCEPQTPEQATDITTYPTAGGVQVSWKPPIGPHSGSITQYEVITYDLDTPGAFISGVGIKGTSGTITDLNVGHRYVVAVVAWNSIGGGLPSGGPSIVVGSTVAPPPPTNIRVTAVDGTTVKIDFCGSKQAGGYKYWVRSVTQTGATFNEDAVTSSQTTHGISFLFPGIWTYEYCVSAFNGNYTSARSTCVTGPKPGDPPAGGSVGGGNCYTCLSDSCNASLPSPPDTAGVGDVVIPGISGGGPTQPVESNYGPDGNSDYPWKHVSCTNPAVSDLESGETAENRWKDLLAESAWNDMISAWKRYKAICVGDSCSSFSVYAGNFFKGKPTMDCATLVTNSNCGETYQCVEAAAFYPANWAVLNSMVVVHEVHLNTYNALYQLHTTMLSDVSNLASTFGGKVESDKAYKIMLDIVGMGLALMLAPTWNSAFKKIPYFASKNANELGTIKDSVNGVVASTLQLLKDSSVAGTTLAQQNLAEETIASLVNITANAISGMNRHLFDGSDTGIGDLHTLISDGHFLTGNQFVDAAELKDTIQKPFMGTLIPYLWKIQNQPFIWPSDKNCNDMGDFKSYACIKGKAHLVMTPKGLPSFCDGSPTCAPNAFSELPGVETLFDGKSWGGVKLDDIINGAMNSYVKNGNKNGGKPLEVGADKQKIQDLLDLGVTTAGVVNIPVCSYEEAHANWDNVWGPRWDNWPCNE